MRLILMLFCCYVWPALLAAQPDSAKTEVLLLGTFHFHNPGLDVAKFESLDILGDQKQGEIRQLVSKLEQFRPDKIFIEAPLSAQLRMDSLLSAYKNGAYSLRSNEIDQVAMRLAKALNHDRLYCSDFLGTQFPIDSLIKVATDNQQFAFLQQFQEMTQTIEKRINEQLTTKTITEVLLWMNAPENNRMGVGVYFDLMAAGDLKNHVGSYLVSEWFRRNMVIYEQIMKQLEGREKRILVLFGSGHTALLDSYMRAHQKLKVVPVEAVLR